MKKFLLVIFLNFFSGIYFEVYAIELLEYDDMRSLFIDNPYYGKYKGILYKMIKVYAWEYTRKKNKRKHYDFNPLTKLMRDMKDKIYIMTPEEYGLKKEIFLRSKNY